MSKSTRRFNFVERTSIDEQDVTVCTFKTAEGSIGIQVDKIDLPEQCGKKHADKWQFARVIVRARDKTADANYEAEIGSVAQVIARKGTLHRDIMKGFVDVTSVKLTVRVVAQNGLILASIDDFAASNDAPLNKQEIFKLRTEDLGEEIWMVDWTSGEPMVVVDVAYAETFLSSPVTHALILPNAFREVLPRAVASVEGDQGEEWAENFVDFARGLAGPLPDSALGEAAEQQWVSTAVAAFAANNRLKSSFIDAFTSEGA